MGPTRWLLEHHRFLMHQCFSLPFAFVFYSLAKCGCLSLTNRYGVHTTSSFCCVHRLSVHFLPEQTPSWSLNSHCSAAKHTVSSPSPPGTCACALEVASWQLSPWAATAGSCSSPLLPFLCWCAAWITATSTPGRLDSRCCGKPRGICSYSTRSIACRSPCASGTELCAVHGGYC